MQYRKDASPMEGSSNPCRGLVKTIISAVQETLRAEPWVRHDGTGAALRSYVCVQGDSPCRHPFSEYCMCVIWRRPLLNDGHNR